MPIDPAADDGGLTFLWTCTRCADWGLHFSWVRASALLRLHREVHHNLYGPESNPGPKNVACVDCGINVTVLRIRSPRCADCQLAHERNLDRARRTAIA